MPRSTQLETTPQDKSNVQEVSKAGLDRRKAASEQKSEGHGKAHLGYWKKRLLKNSYTHGGQTFEVNEWSVKIQHLGRRKTFSLGTTNRELAAGKARDIYLSILAKGWDQTEAQFNPGMLVRKDDPSLADFFVEVESKSGLRPKTFRNYRAAFRTIVSGIFGLGGDESRYDGRSGGAKKWAEAVDATKLAAVTPDRIHQWKIGHIKTTGSNPVKQASARRTVNSYIRCARSLFSPGILRFVKVRLPNPLPFQGVELEEQGSMRYKSRIKPELLVTAARNQLRRDHPESYKVFLLGLFCGLRRSEIDLLEWSAIDWENHLIVIEMTEHLDLKTDDSENVVEVDAEVLSELRSYISTSQSTFVVSSPHPPCSRTDRQYYRCQHIFKHVTSWLRSKGVTANKPLHELRKEFGSQVNLRHGIYAASRALRHSDITTSARHYIGKKERVTVGLGHLLAQPSVPQPAERQSNKAVA